MVCIDLECACRSITRLEMPGWHCLGEGCERASWFKEFLSAVSLSQPVAWALMILMGRRSAGGVEFEGASV